MAIHRVTFGSFNLLNLQEAGKTVHKTKNYYTPTAYKKKVAWVGNMLSRIGADVVAFQEVWSGKALKEAIGKSGQFSPTDLVGPIKNGKDTSVALVTKLAHKTPVWHRNFPGEFVMKSKAGGTSGPAVSVTISRFSRPVLQVPVMVRISATKTKEVQVFIAHLKSKLPSDLSHTSVQKLWATFGNGTYDNGKPKLNTLGNKIAAGIGSALANVQRSTEAAALRLILAREMYGNNKPVVLLGDLNDGPLSVSTGIITGDPDYRTVLKRSGGRRNDTEMFSTSWLQQYRSLRDVYYSHIFKSRRESLDHILVSEQFYDHSERRIWSFEELKVHNDHLKDEHVERGKDKTVSDHGIVTATFRYNPWK
jgi:endonuclease/exonuclease/phosphatase family metal-dependent hydrolase